MLTGPAASQSSGQAIALFIALKRIYSNQVRFQMLLATQNAAYKMSIRHIQG